MQVRQCGYLYRVDESQTDRFISSKFECYCLNTSLPNQLNDEVNKRNPEKSVPLWGSKPYALN